MRITLKRHALLYSATGALFLAGTLQAGLVSTVNASGEFIDLAQSFGCSNAGTTTASCSVSVFPGGAFHSASGSYHANAQYGSLDTTSVSSVYDTTNGGPGYLEGTSVGSFSDTFLLTGGIGSGTLLFVTEYWGYGVSESCAPCVGAATVTLNTFTGQPNQGVPIIVNLPFSFSFGTLFNLNASASAHSSALGHELAQTNAHLKIDAIEVLNSSGALITDYAVTTGSGATYQFVTPEPGTFALVIAALITPLVIRRKSVRAHREG